MSPYVEMRIGLNLTSLISLIFTNVNISRVANVINDASLKPKAKEPILNPDWIAMIPEN